MKLPFVVVEGISIKYDGDNVGPTEPVEDVYILNTVQKYQTTKIVIAGEDSMASFVHQDRKWHLLIEMNGEGERIELSDDEIVDIIHGLLDPRNVRI